MVFIEKNPEGSLKDDMSKMPISMILLCKRIPLTLALTILLFLLGQVEWIVPYAGDGHYSEELVLKEGAVLMHSPLTTIIHKMTYLVVKPWGVRAWYAISLSNALAGAIAIQVLFAIRKHPVFLAVNLLSGSFLVFVGEVEYYAWVGLFQLLTYLAVERFFEGRWKLWPVWLFFFLSALCHMLALFYILALFWVMRKKQNFHGSEFALPFAGFMILYLVMVLFCRSEGPDLDLGRLTPLFHINRKGQLFTFFSLAHWELLAYFHWKGSFLQLLPVEIPLLILWRKQFRSLYSRYLLFCSMIGIGWTTIWHPDLGRLDWDLFSQMYLPIHVLLGLTMTDALSPWRSHIGPKK